MLPVVNIWVVRGAPEFNHAPAGTATLDKRMEVALRPDLSTV